MSTIDPFSYLSVIISVVLGLAMTQVLQGVRGLILTRARVKLYWPSVIWALIALMVPIQAWWADFSMRREADWTFLALLVSLFQAISIYMAAALVLPDIHQEKCVELRRHFHTHRYWFFGANIASIVFSLLKTIVLFGHLPGRADLAFQLTFAAVATVAAVVQSEALHRLLAPAGGMLFAIYITVLFGRL